MNFYFIQHGKVKSKEEDRVRPLSEKGGRDVKWMVIHKLLFCRWKAPSCKGGNESPQTR